MDLDPLSSCKNSKKNLDSYYFVTIFDFLSLKNDVNVPSNFHGSATLVNREAYLETGELNLLRGNKQLKHMQIIVQRIDGWRSDIGRTLSIE
jgi:hypothetical protein